MIITTHIMSGGVLAGGTALVVEISVDVLEDDVSIDLFGENVLKTEVSVDALEEGEPFVEVLADGMVVDEETFDEEVMKELRASFLVALVDT
ncbi:hypothetical protein TWF703_010010 [Orbilia oligospora]|uniref:Uncharacterized protein n=1 Tax=Orbilia oligospora TaxID=2813651 RepID=A0A7C8JJ43_ORBOL|nr:hypothetical protein TWF703_010010 [Orbilia oligospora]